MPLHVKSLHRMINVKAALKISTQVGNFRERFETKSMSCSMHKKTLNLQVYAVGLLNEINMLL